ncbi:hypothetical protein M885DRAFT_508412 [Pelagophyceae sp. CCMP2097]|nr:hypothetical protein M885DRAFT_508412 [Pelagophyceae sp. CCMP2097]
MFALVVLVGLSRHTAAFHPGAHGGPRHTHRQATEALNEQARGLDPESLSSRKKTKLKPELLVIADPPPKISNKKEIEVEDMLRELREIQGKSPRSYCILGTRHCSYLHEQIIELLSYALVLSGNHVYTSGSSGTNAAAIRGALRAEEPDLLTVVLPQSMDKQTPEAKDLIKRVRHVEQMPENDGLSLEVASRRCNSRLITLADHLIAFAFHESMTIVATTIEAEAADKIVTVMYLD